VPSPAGDVECVDEVLGECRRDDKQEVTCFLLLLPAHIAIGNVKAGPGYAPASDRCGIQHVEPYEENSMRLICVQVRKLENCDERIDYSWQRLPVKAEGKGLQDTHEGLVSNGAPRVVIGVKEGDNLPPSLHKWGKDGATVV